jgi:hypothetical protein
VAAIHLKPVYVRLFRQTADMAHRGQDNDLLFQQVQTKLHVVVDYTMVADATL